MGDIGAHIVDLTQFVTRQRITGVSALTETFVTERPLPTEASGLSASAGNGGGRTGLVTVDDAALFVARLSGGAVATYEATRFATGRKNGLRVTEPTHPYLSAWWPPGHMLGYEHSFTHQMRDLIEALAAERDPHPTFVDASQVQYVLDAVERSAKSATWTPVGAVPDTVAA